MSTLLTLFGGLGLFLIGLHLMIDGLKAAAGDALSNYLARFTGGTTSAVLTGAGVTALVQSSSATTVATIGFVSAGFLSFSQAFGVVVGANIGTTSTSWLVSLLGLRVSISAFALPMVGLGAVLMILRRGGSPAWGLALAGFGLIFIGIQTLQEGMAGATAFVDVSRFGADDLVDRLLLVGAGIVMTVIMQSSSAAVATTLVALSAGAIDFYQAAALVIGQAVGTTVTAVIAAIGGSTAAKRTSLAHVLFNVAAGVLAWLALPLFASAILGASRLLGLTDPAVQLAVFHTTFKLLGAAMILPAIRPFSRFIEYLIPERGNPLTRHLDPSVLATPALALGTAVRTVFRVAERQFEVASRALATLQRPSADEQAETGEALEQIQQFLARLRHGSESDWDHDRFVNLILSLDHLSRVNDALARMPMHHRLAPHHALAGRIHRVFREATRWIGAEQPEPLPDALLSQLKQLDSEYHKRRRQWVRESPPADQTLADLVAMRWLDQFLHHMRHGLPHLARLAYPDHPDERDTDADPVRDGGAPSDDSGFGN